MSNSDAYSDVDLWEAIYPSGRTAADWPTTIDTGLAPPPGLPRRVGWQWRGTTPLFGESVDLSVFDRAWVLGLEGEMARTPLLEDKLYKFGTDHVYWYRSYVLWWMATDAAWVNHPAVQDKVTRGEVEDRPPIDAAGVPIVPLQV